MNIRKANIYDSSTLTQIAFKAKKHWNYPDEYLEIWQDELTITIDYIINNIVFVAEKNNKIIGFYSIAYNPNEFYSGEVFIENGYWLEHIFILPEFHKKGIGTTLISHAIQYSKQHNIEKLLVFTDPFAKGFYDKIGAKYVRESKSSIPGRNIPVYEITVS